MIRIALVFASLLALAGCARGYGSKSSSVDSSGSSATATITPAATPAPAAAAEAPKVHKLADGLVYEDLVVGNGRMADPGLTAVVHYTVWLSDGTKIQSSRDNNVPFEFTLGEGKVIRGWEEGVKGMRIGGRRKLTIPPDLAWGAQGSAPAIPPNATVVFDIELLGIK